MSAETPDTDDAQPTVQLTMVEASILLVALTLIGGRTFSELGFGADYVKSLRETASKLRLAINREVAEARAKEKAKEVK